MSNVTINQNENQFIGEIVSTLTTTQALNLLQNLTATNPYFEALEQSGASQRQQLCQFTNGNYLFNTSNSCFCGNTLPLLYCNAIYSEQIDQLTASPSFSKRTLSQKYQEGLITRFQEKYAYLMEKTDSQKKREKDRKKRHPLNKRGIFSWCNPQDLEAIKETDENGQIEATDEACTTDTCVWPVWFVSLYEIDER
jgi:uncharacterized UBP type Zn finger protein